MPFNSNRPRELPASAVAELMQGRKIEAIKIVRQQWNLDRGWRFWRSPES